MTEHLFITPTGKAHSHWIEVFPGSKIQFSFSEVYEINAFSVVWVEWPKGLEERHYHELESLVSTGKPVVVLSANPNEQQAKTAVSLGAKGYCHSYATTSQLQDVALVVTSGGLWLGPDLVQKVLFGARVAGAQKADTDVSERLKELTKRELAVARAVAIGHTNKEISMLLGIGERTVKSHLSIIFQKVQVRDRVQLALLLNGIDFPSS
ncbi:response regulator transcription factor [Aurantivibrio plasticivorans]